MTNSLYARPPGPRIFLRPLLATLVLHGLLLFVLTLNWSSAREVRTVKPVTRVIQAKLVDVADLQPEPKPVAKPKTKKTPVAKPAAKKPAPKKVVKKAATKPAAAKPKAKTSKPKPKPKAEPKPEPRMTEQELASIARTELAQAMAQEEQEQQQAAASAEQMTASYAALIQQTVMNYWSRPPSARNGMEALLAIQLIPSGDVISVTLLKSSGSASFDRSAINAVEKAGSFPELEKLPLREFEKTFRRFRLLFRPEDLRY